MKKYSGLEKRKCSRAKASLVISYRIKQEVDNSDLSQSKNVSSGGMLLTTNRKFNKGTQLLLTLRFPFFPEKIQITAIVVESEEVVKNIIYNTHLEFFGLEEIIQKGLQDIVSKKLENQSDE